MLEIPLISQRHLMLFPLMHELEETALNWPFGFIAELLEIVRQVFLLLTYIEKLSTP